MPLRSTSQRTPQSAGRVRSVETAYAVFCTSSPTISGSMVKVVLLSCLGSFGKSSALRAFMTNLLLPQEIVSFSPSALEPHLFPGERFHDLGDLLRRRGDASPPRPRSPLTFDVTDMSRSVAEILNTPFSALMSTVERIGIVVFPGTTPDMAFILWVSSPRGTLTFTPPPPETGEDHE